MTAQIGAELTRANATLQRGAQFLANGLGGGAATRLSIGGRYRARVLGNGLRELDRFLNLLIDAVAGARGLSLPAHERNTANKLARLRALLGVPNADHARLVALGRSRDCLFHCDGLVRRGDAPGDGAMTAGWPMPGEARLRRVAIGERLSLSGAELDEICAYYRVIAARLLDEAGPIMAGPRSIPETLSSPGWGRGIGAR